MNSLTTTRVTGVLERLFAEAETTDAAYIADILDNLAPGEDPIATLVAAEQAGYQTLYHRAAANFLSVSPEFGQLLYICTRAGKATRVVEFGTSFGVSTVYLACAVADNGGGMVTGTELEASKALRAQEHLAAAGVADLVQIRVGDALETLRDGVGGPIDLVHLDGAMSLYRPVLELLQPHLRVGALIVAENGCADYLSYLHGSNGAYVSVTVPVDPMRGNQLSLYTGPR
jgi:predicted O-methyltransferase YrrM